MQVLPHNFSCFGCRQISVTRTVLCTLTIFQCRLHNAVVIKEHNNDISIFNFRVIQGSQNTTNTSSQSTTQLQTIPILHTDIFVFVKRHIPENSDIQQRAWESHRSPSESVDIKWPRNLAHVFCVYLPVLACSGPSRLITPCLDCIMRRAVGFLCWHKEGKNQWAQLIPHVLIGGVEWNCVRTWVAVRKCRTRSDWDKSYYSVP